MSASVAPSRSRIATSPLGLRAVFVIVASVVGGAVLSAVIAAIAHAAGASNQFQPLHASAFVPLIIIGVVIATGAWLVLRAKASNPGAVARWLVPTVLVLSFVPDVLVGVSGSMSGSSWGGVVALMLMHLAVAAVAVPLLVVLLPLGNGRSAAR